MKILIFGSDGQLGRELVKCFPEAMAVSRQECDLSDLDALEDFLVQCAAEYIINASAYTDVDLAETHVDDAYGVNCIAPQAMAAYAAAHQIPLIHYSTNYVFDGSKKTPYLETDEIHPLSVYGQSKVGGDVAVQATCMVADSPYYILRTSWLYGSAHNNKNFIRTVLRLAHESENLQIVADQLGTPTSAAWLAQVTKEIVMHGLKIPSGIYHAVPRGDTTWYGLACWVIAVARHAGADILARPDQIKAISSAGYPMIARRPTNGSLDHRRLLNVLGHSSFPHWQEQVTGYVQYLVKSFQADSLFEK